ncbi:MAG: GGDEF domain-containing protein [Anaerolineales bacterium]|nr:GGDEF domain-containing protein [Anaerolineales bacterium]
MKIIDLGHESIGKPFWVILAVILLGGVAALDFITGAELSFSIFYLIPIALFTWAVDGKVGIAAAFISAGIWLFIEIISSSDYSSAFVYFWNAVIRLGFFLLPVLLLRNLEQERRLARTDFLTGATNNRQFRDQTQREIDRSARYRHPFTVVFIDIDNFKLINDTFGHTFGDKVLKAIVENIKSNLRKTDVIARMGGDEFALLLPEVNPENARTAISKMRQKLQEEMLKNKWPITFSIGVVSVITPDLAVDEVISIADKMMYSVKNYGKDNIKYTTH